MRTVLCSNVAYYHPLARALFEAGHLAQYITCPSVAPGQPPPRFLPDYWRSKLAGRDLEVVPTSLVRQLYLPEILQKSLPALKLCSADHADRINNYLFDRTAARHLEPCTILHFVSGIGLHCARKAKQWGSTAICDVRQEHPWFQRDILAEEAERWQVEAVVPGTSYEARVLEEFTLADYFVLPSLHAKNTFVERGFAADRIWVWPYGVNLTIFPERQQPPPNDRFNIVYVGSVTLRKGAQYLLEATRLLQPLPLEITFVGALSPEMEPILKRYEGLFTWAGAMPKTQLHNVYRDASVFVLPSLADSFSLATLEAMSSGVPVIISENTGAREMVTQGCEGFVVPIRNAAAIAEHLAYLYHHYEAAAEMGRAGARRARTCTWERYRSIAMAHYDTLRPESRLVT